MVNAKEQMANVKTPLRLCLLPQWVFALSPLGERVARDGAFISRRGTGEGVCCRLLNGRRQISDVYPFAICYLNFELLFRSW
jgi:hypothetical protein